MQHPICRPQTILDLPREVLERVQVAVSRRRAYLQHALVCRLWRDLAFHVSTVQPPKATVAHGHSTACAVAVRVRVDRGLTLQSLLRELELVGPGLERLELARGSVRPEWEGAQERDGVTWVELVSILQRCTRLRELYVWVTLVAQAREQEQDEGEEALEGQDGFRLQEMLIRGELEPVCPDAATAKLPTSLPSLTSLHLCGKLHNVGFLGRCFPNLRKLVLYCDQTVDLGIEIPASISLLTKLRDLQITGNLISLPPEIGSLQALRRLHICGSTRENLPDSLCDLPHLRELIISEFEGEFGTLPAQLGSLSSLRSLCLVELKLGDVPRSITQLTRLRELHLPGWPACREDFWTPKALSRLTSLHLGPPAPWLNLPVNYRNALPTSAASLGSLKIMSLYGKFEALPNLSGLTSLEELSLTVNGLSSLSPNRLSLPQLRTMTVESEELRALFPGGVSLPQLRSLEVEAWSQNGCTDDIMLLCALSKEKWHVPRLADVSFVNVTADGLPAFLRKCASLEKLTLSHCKFDRFPGELLQCPALRHVSLDSMGITLPQSCSLDLSRLPH